MRHFLNIAALMLVLLANSCSAQVRYNDYFTPDRLRIDLMFAGNSQTQSVYLDGLHFEKEWSGTREHLLPDFDYGEYAIDLYTATGKKIFSQDFARSLLNGGLLRMLPSFINPFPTPLKYPFLKSL